MILQAHNLSQADIRARLTQPFFFSMTSQDGMFSHADCADPTRGDGATCLTCRFKEEYVNDPSFEEPKCHMCVHGNESVGPLVKSFAKPMTMKKWKTNMGQFQRSTFGKNKFVHVLCGM